LDVAGRVHGEVHEPVLRPRLEHVAEKGDRRGHLRTARAVHVEVDRHVGFLRLALDTRLPCWALAHRVSSFLMSAAIPCPARPSSRASVLRCGSAAASPAGEYSMTLERFRKSSVESGDENRAVPPVGRTWFGPAT